MICIEWWTFKEQLSGQWSTDQVAWFRIPCCHEGTVNATRKTFSGRRKGRLIRSCTALMRILRCLATELVWIWLRSTHGWSDQSTNRILTMSPRHVRVDGCVCGMRAPTQGDLRWKPLRIQSNSAQVKKRFRGVRCSHSERHEVCPEDSEHPRTLARRAARGIMHFERTADEIVGWLKETETGNSQFIPNDVTGAESDIPSTAAASEMKISNPSTVTGSEM